MLDLVNKTPFTAALLPALAKDGSEHLVVVTKATFEVSRTRGMQIAAEQAPIAFADVFHGDPLGSSLKYASDGALRKNGVDVVLSGAAFGPASGVSTLDVELRIGGARKIVRAFGPRVWSRGSDGKLRPSRPGMLKMVALRWESAFGGTDTTDPDPRNHAWCESNPVGRGFVAPGSRVDLAGQLLPELEDPDDPIREVGHAPRPGGFGFVASSWLPRRAWAGTYDETWRSERAPLLPLDFDDRHFSAASAGLSLPSLAGNEAISATHVRPGGGAFEATLPRHHFDVEVTSGATTTKTRARLDTVVIETELDRLLLTYRAAVPLRRKLLDIDRVKVREVSA
jgi:hypothetical protein